jgi:hypothetical protein
LRRQEFPHRPTQPGAVGGDLPPGTAGKKRSFDAKNAKVIKLKSAAYNAANNTVTLTPKKAFGLTKQVQLRINGQPPSGFEQCRAADRRRP